MSLESLKEAMLEVAKDMEDSAADAEVLSSREIKSWAKQIRVACKAAGSDATIAALNPMSSVMLSPQAQHAMEIEKAKAEFRKARKEVGMTAKAEDGGQVSVRIVGGPKAPDDVPTWFALDSMRPVGSVLNLEGAAYRLEKDDEGVRLTYDAALTMDWSK